MNKTFPHWAFALQLFVSACPLGCVDDHSPTTPAEQNLDADPSVLDAQREAPPTDTSETARRDFGAIDSTPPDSSPIDGRDPQSEEDQVVYGRVDIVDGRSDLLDLVVPTDTLSLTLVAAGDESVMYTVEHLEDANGRVIVSERPEGVEITDDHRRLTPFPGPFLSPNRSASASTAVGTLLAPNNPDIRVPPGTWRFGLGALGEQGRVTTTASVTAIIKRAGTPQVTGALTVHFFFTGARGWTAGTAENNPEFQEAFGRMRRVYEAVGVRLDDPTYDDIPERFRLVDAGPQEPGPNESTLHQMFRLNDYDSGVALFFVDRIGTGQNGGFIAGISGGTPGPALQGSSVRGGIAISTEMLPDPASIGHVMGHETGHFLGLFHTQELSGGISDQIQDTEDGPGGNDNLMFPTVTSDLAHLTDEQAWVLHRSILVTPLEEARP